MEEPVQVEKKTPHSEKEEQQLYSVEEVFDSIDKQFIGFYGEYGRNIVNNRRSQWNKDGIVNFKML